MLSLHTSTVGLDLATTQGATNAYKEPLVAPSQQNSALLCLYSAGRGRMNGRETWQCPAALFTPRSCCSTMAGDRLRNLALCSGAGLPSFSVKNLFFCCGLVLGCFDGIFWGMGREIMFGCFLESDSMHGVHCVRSSTKTPAEVPAGLSPLP